MNAEQRIKDWLYAGYERCLHDKSPHNHKSMFQASWFRTESFAVTVVPSFLFRRPDQQGGKTFGHLIDNGIHIRVVASGWCMLVTTLAFTVAVSANYQCSAVQL